MTLRSGLIQNLNPDGPGLISGLSPSVVAAILANFDYRTPVTQESPATAAGFAAACGDGAATPSYIWLCDEPSGNLVDAIAGEPLVPTNSPLQNRTTTIYDGINFTNKKGIESTPAGAGNFISDDNGVANSNSTSVAWVARVRFKSKPAGSYRFANKREAGGGQWMNCQGSSNGELQVIAYDGSTLKAAGVPGGALVTGAWMTIAGVWNETARTVTAIMSGHSSVSTAYTAPMGSQSNSDFLTLGPAAGQLIPGFQCSYFAVLEGAAAEAIDQAAIDTFHKHASDPGVAAGKTALTSAARDSLVSARVAAGSLAHFSGGTDLASTQIPITYNPALDGGGGGLGLLCQGPITNVILQSESLTAPSAWNTFNTTVLDNQMSAPDGFLSAGTVTATSNDGSIWDQVVGQVKEYTMSALAKRNGGSDVAGKIKLWDATNASFVGSTSFTATADWQEVTVVGTMLAGCVAMRHYCFVDVSGESISFHVLQHETQEGTNAKIRTSGAAATLVQSDYRSTGNWIQEETGEVVAVFAISKLPASGETHYIFDTVTAADRRALSVDSAGVVKFLVNNAAGGLVAEVTLGTAVIDTEYTAQCQWDDAAGLGGSSVRAKLNALSPVSGGSSFTDGAGYAAELSIGASAATADTALNGNIARITTYDGQNAI